MNGIWILILQMAAMGAYIIIAILITCDEANKSSMILKQKKKNKKLKK